ncbi:hypothetical protein SAMN05444166_4696 [Singulisphaera sp. GP187]|uniref:hypothetical protein n=1 Tax=Singulisphaera sp. GP187 TaxID=1882752 RepID=UPI0009289288|nr:hypothetical protein [Singulisphaera sp. GP187]SIO43473.1 hypothetical protein SAMN05444166_4696 [Singulisphaera sp. GP187]
MRTLTPALAIGWQLWLRSRQGAHAALATLAGLALFGPFVFSRVPHEYAIVGALVPAFGIIAYFMNATLFVEATGNLTSGYPKRMYALPVPTRVLVFWPLLIGAVVMALLWVAIAGMVFRQSGFRLPVLLPALGLVAIMSWLQVLSWSPLSPAWLRLVAVTLVVGAAGGIVWSLVMLGAVGHERVAALLAVAVVVAYPLGLAGVASDRRGDAWRAWPVWLRLPFGTARGPRRPFRSPAQAQLWYEWRCHGLVFPITTTLNSLLILGLGTARNAWAVHSLLLLVLFIMPVLLATSVGTVMGRLTPFWVKHPRVVEFLAIRPMSTRDLVAAKLRMTALSVLLSWLLVVVIMVLCLGLVDQPGGAAKQWQALKVQFPGGHAASILALAFVLGPALAFRQLTDYFPITLSGRPWLERLTAAVIFSVVAGILGIALFPRTLPSRFLVARPWLVASLLAIKAVVTSWSFRAALRRGLLQRRDLLQYTTTWMVLTAIAIGLSVLILPARLQPATRTAVLLSVVVFVPISRFALAPLALDWNRHR